MNAIFALGLLLITSAMLYPATAVSEGFTVDAFVDTYFASSSNNISGEERSYFTQAVKNNHISLNIASVSFTYDNTLFRARFAPQIGDSVNVNYKSEPGDAVQHLQEGYVGYYLEENTTIDVGIFLSHIGAESWLSKDNINYTRSFIAEFSPYYESGAKLTHKFSDAISGQVLILNGWQNVTDERHPAIGSQLTSVFGSWTLNSNTFFGHELNSSRYFYDGVLSYKYSESILFTGSIDTGYQSVPSEFSGFWWGYTAMSKYTILDKLTVNARFEGYADQNGTIIQTPQNVDFIAHGISIGADYALLRNLKLRFEAKHIWSPNRIFEDDQSLKREDNIFTIGVSAFGTNK